MMMEKKFNSSDESQSRKATASDVAKKAGVSKWTVSRAFTDGASISDAARKLVLESAKELGYRPNLLARSLSKKNSHIIGIVVDQLSNPNLAALLDEVSQQLQLKGYMALLLNITSKSSYESSMKLADQLQIDGLLFLGTVLSKELISFAQDIHHIPLVQICRNNNNQGIPVVSTDGYLAGQQIARLLFEHGCLKFGYMKGPDNDATPLLRFEGYNDELLSLGMSNAIIIDAHNYRRLSAFNAMQTYIEETPIEDRIHALFCENDIIAVGALEAIAEARISDSIAVVGFDNIDLAAAAPYQLTTYSQPIREIVSEAVKRVTRQVKLNNDILLQGELVLRTSHLRK